MPDTLPPQPKCPLGARCPGAHGTEFGLYIPDCLYSGDPGVLRTHALFVCASCSSSIQFLWELEKWRVYRIDRAGP